MKAKFLHIFCVVALLAGCSREETFLRADVDDISLSANSLEAQTVRIEASASWVVSLMELPEWLGAKYSEEDDNVLLINALSLNESLEARSSSVTVVSGDGLVLTIPVTQEAMDISLSVSPLTLEFEGRPSEAQVLAVTTDLASWEVLTGENNWLTAVRSTEDNTVIVSALATRLLEARTGSIVVRPVNDAYWAHTVTVAVEQAGIGLVVQGEAVSEATGAIDIPAQGGEFTLWVYSKAAWTVEKSAGDEAVKLNLTAGEADIENGIPIVMTVAENVDTQSFNFTLTWTSDGQTYEYSCRQSANSTTGF